MTARLDSEEQGILDSFDRGEWQPVPGVQSEMKRYQEYAKATRKQDKYVNIQILERDLIVLQKRALDEGVPYQELISSILHKYISGLLVEKGLIQESNP